VIGIDVGITTLMAANLNRQLPWKIFMKAPEMSLAMKKLYGVRMYLRVPA